MYNGQIINFLLENRCIKKKDLILSIKGTNSTMESIINGNPTVKTLEKVADFFKVSMDLFFDREMPLTNTVGNISGTGHKIQNGQNNVMQESQEKEITHLKELLKEKERLIQVLMKK